MDTFDPQDFGEQPSQRMATVLVYLSGERVMDGMMMGGDGDWGGGMGMGGGLMLPLSDRRPPFFERRARTLLLLLLPSFCRACSLGPPANHTQTHSTTKPINRTRHHHHHHHHTHTHTPSKDVEEGGETIFKKEGRDGAGVEVADFKTCEPGAFAYRPRRGDALLFFSLTPDLRIDPRALHGGCPVRKGVKWVATKWVHDKPFRPEED